MAHAIGIILAAGKSSRMKTRRPKVLHEVCGRPMLAYVLRACYEAGCGRVLVVVGHGKEEVMAQFAEDARITWVEQAEQLGTADAVKACLPELHKAHEVFIVPGDGPLVRGQVLRTLHEMHREEGAVASLATAEMDDPSGYGRVVRDENGEFVEVVEEADASPEQKKIREVFPGYYSVKVEELAWALSRVSDENVRREYYLTDIFRHLKEAGKKVLAVQAVSAEEALAVNTRQHLAEVDSVMQERIQRQLREAGVTIVSPINTYVEDGVSAGMDTVVHPFTLIGRDSSIGPDCVIGPFAVVAREAIVPEGTTVGTRD